METIRLVPHPLDDVSRLVWRRVQQIAQLTHQIQEAAVEVGRQMRSAAALFMRVLDGATLQTTRVRTTSQTEFVFGPLTFSFASGVLFSRPQAAA